MGKFVFEHWSKENILLVALHFQLLNKFCFRQTTFENDKGKYKIWPILG